MNLNFSDTPTPQAPMLNLTKGAVLDLTKTAPSLKSVVLGAGWDVAQTGANFDLDISAFLLNAQGRVTNVATDVVFFNQMQQPGIKLEGDNRTGAGDGDDERIDIELDKLAPGVEKIVFFVTIFEAQNRKQTFGMVNNSYVRLLDVDNNEKELCRFELKENASTNTAITFAEIYRENGSWKFKAIGDGCVGDLNTLLSKYM